MIVKSIVFVYSLLLIMGCGVMNNPDDDKRVEDGTFTNAGEVLVKVSKINTQSLTITDTNRLFINGIGDMSIDALTSYRIFETSASTEQFLTDLNSTAQTLESGDLAIVDSWINNIKNANINYQDKNLLFYPILQSEDCGFKDSVTIKENNATIIIQNSRNQCDEAFVYHVLMYEVDKSIENITVKAFDEGNVTILNEVK